MERRELLAALAASAVFRSDADPATVTKTYLELKTWHLHSTHEDQPARVADYLENGLSPALARAGAKLAGAFSNVIGPGSPSYVTLTEYASFADIEQVITKLVADEPYQRELAKLGSGAGLPFVRVDSSLLRSFDRVPRAVIPDSAERRAPRIFELRTYESQTFTTLARKIAMFNTAEIGIFERVGMRPVFFGETIIGSNQPNLTYMLSFDDLAARDKLWHDFGADADWKKLSSQPQLKDPEIVANISNVILRPLTFSAIR
ncbi:MAG: NIPSNAP family protein [Acidobacteriaceae bacterium]|nr:NIPSNAP family protein [Acidobacteriaceae bacterium]